MGGWEVEGKKLGLGCILETLRGKMIPGGGGVGVQHHGVTLI